MDNDSLYRSICSEMGQEMADYVLRRIREGQRANDLLARVIERRRQEGKAATQLDREIASHLEGELAYA